MSKPPFLFPPVDVLQRLAASAPPPPAWLRAELENRLVLWLNHVLMQEPQAMDRLRRQSGKTLLVQWDRFECAFQATPAGLLARSETGSAPDLRLKVQEPSPLVLAQKVLQGDKPQVDIQGDVQLAAEVAWLVDNVRWDVEEDLSRVLGDAVAHTLVRAVKAAAQGLRGFLQKAAR
jgi:ubiquinone biosynthesis accessory factor UbiJ